MSEPTTTHAPKLARFEIRWIQGIKAAIVQHIPDRGLVPITGDNGSGKTSIIRAIVGALGGRARVNERVINDESPDGNGYVHLTLDTGWEWEVRRHHTEANPKGALYVSGPDGGKHGQTKLDEIMHGIDPDVQSFFGLPVARQAEILLSLGVDPDLPEKLAEFNRREAALRLDRTPHISAQRKAQAVARPNTDRPTPVDVTAETERLSALHATAQERADMMRALDRKAEEQRRAEEEVARVVRHKEALERGIEARKRELDLAKLELANTSDELEARKEEADEVEEAMQAALVAADAFPDPTADIDAVRERIRAAQAIDGLLEPWRAWDRAQEDLVTTAAEVERLTADIKNVEAERAAAIAAADIPVRGVSFDANAAPSYHGRPLELASGAERTRLALDVARAVGLGFTLIDEGDVLDDHTLAEIDAEAREGEGMQVIMCSVGRSGAGVVTVAGGLATMAGGEPPALE